MKTAVDKKLLAERMDSFPGLCLRAGIRVTHQRTEVYREVAATLEHPDADSIYRRVRRRIPQISLDTVYRTLGLFGEKGIISRVSYPGDRARFDGNTGQHHHFICTKCGLIRDFRSDALDAVRPRLKNVPCGRITSVQIELRGLCRRCARA